MCEGLIIFMDIEIIYSFDFFDMCGTIIFVYMRSEFAGDVQEGHGWSGEVKDYGIQDNLDWFFDDNKTLFR